MLWGAYHFADGTDPVRQADHFLSAVASAWRGANPPTGTPGVLLVLDFEKNTHYPGGTMSVGQAVTFIERVHQRTGVYPGVYSNEYRVRDTFGRSANAGQRDILQRCWLWVANYHYEPRAIAPWGHVAIHRRRQMRSASALVVPEKRGEHSARRAQHVSRQRGGAETILAGERLDAAVSCRQV
jgi:GH25 family lysozyme M1 (1,4-beta-N-acetylmuramidase)